VWDFCVYEFDKNTKICYNSKQIAKGQKERIYFNVSKKEKKRIIKRAENK